MKKAFLVMLTLALLVAGSAYAEDGVAKKNPFADAFSSIGNGIHRVFTGIGDAFKGAGKALTGGDKKAV